ncbi:MAG: L,D-transpeptidase, partial [Pseudomonadota bacterium]|nr:L,D-transpeptidase [Pseudomonadota bacterium]
MLFASAASAQPATAVAQQPLSTKSALPAWVPPQLFAGGRSLQVLQVQVMLDRAQHSPGVIDGAVGGNTRRAIASYRAANELGSGDAIDDRLIEHLAQDNGGELFQTHIISESDVAGPFRNVPDEMTGQAKLDTVGFESAAEGLAEKFHMAESFLQALNPGSDFSKAGTEIRVIKAGGEQLSAKVAKVEVRKDSNRLLAYDEGGRLVATYPITVGSSFHPSPNMTLEVLAVAMDPTYHFDPEGRDWGPDEKLTIAAGPNNPVGTVWIDLSRDGYGIHG